MHPSEAFAAVLAAARDDIARAVREWRAQERLDEVLALWIDGESAAAPRVTAMSRTELEQTIVAFEPTIAIELAKKEARSRARGGRPARLRETHLLD